jgi:hypothetical protein
MVVALQTMPITTVAPGRHEFRPFREFVVKEDLEYYCDLKLGSRQKDGVALCGGVSAEHAPERVEHARELNSPVTDHTAGAD